VGGPEAVKGEIQSRPNLPLLGGPTKNVQGEKKNIPGKKSSRGDGEKRERIAQGFGLGTETKKKIKESPPEIIVSGRANFYQGGGCKRFKNGKG